MPFVIFDEKWRWNQWAEYLEFDVLCMYTGIGGDPITYQASEEAVPAALKMLSLISDTYEQISGVTTIKDGIVTFLDYLLEQGIEHFSEIPANSLFTYTMTTHTFLKVILVKPLTASDDYWEVQLMASKTNTCVSVVSHIDYKPQGEEIRTLDVYASYDVIHKGNYYSYSITDAVKDYCTGLGIRYSYVTSIPIKAGIDGQVEENVATIYPYTPLGLGTLLLDNYD